jgi:hypothetical protein
MQTKVGTTLVGATTVGAAVQLSPVTDGTQASCAKMILSTFTFASVPRSVTVWVPAVREAVILEVVVPS